MIQNSYGRLLIQSLIKLSGVPDDQILDFLLAIIKSHNLSPDLVSLNNIKDILEVEIQNIALNGQQETQLESLIMRR